MVLAVLRGENWRRELGRLPLVPVAAGSGCLVGRATILFVSSVGAVALTVTRPSLHSKTAGRLPTVELGSAAHACDMILYQCLPGKRKFPFGRCMGIATLCIGWLLPLLLTG